MHAQAEITPAGQRPLWSDLILNPPDLDVFALLCYKHLSGWLPGSLRGLRQRPLQQPALCHLWPSEGLLPTPGIDPNTARFKRTLIYFNTDTQYANFRGNPLYQATKRH